jgi:hypothetical protein
MVRYSDPLFPIPYTKPFFFFNSNKKKLSYMGESDVVSASSTLLKFLSRLDISWLKAST